ncbi:MAG: hypothetical protein HYX24_06120 [Candidatus Aenigmarchaeota archaeon]|nr:hypothetical protein [Candidatus Aenigmarchaeota archaeon]
MEYKFTKIFLILGLVSTLIIFFNSGSLISYGLSVVIFTLVIGSIGLIIDKLTLKQYKLPVILIIIYILIGGFYLFAIITSAQCLGCRLVIYENMFTGECKKLCVGCGSYAPWYLATSASCVEPVLRDECNKLTPNALEVYNNSCDIYVEINRIFYRYK